MSAAREVAAAAERLRAAGARLRAMPGAERVAALGRVLERWRDPAGAPQRRLVRELPAAAGFSAENVAAGLAHALEGWTAEAFHELARRELGELDAARGVELTAVVLGGALPMPTLLQMLAPLASGSPVLVRGASADPLTAEVVAGSLAAEAAVLGACVERVDFGHDDRAAWQAFGRAPCLVATGSDASVAHIREHAKPGGHFLGYGHRLSLAAFGPQATRGAALARAAEALAFDVALWDQLGCLSPIALYVDAGEPAAPQRAARALAEALAKLEARLPRGRVAPVAAARFAAERADAEFRAAQGGGAGCLADPAGRWCVSCERDAAPRPAPLHRFVRVHPVDGPDALLAALAPYAAHLAGVARAGFGSEQTALDARLRALGASRVCAPGELQAPLLDWARDARGVLRPFLATSGAPARPPGGQSGP